MSERPGPRHVAFALDREPLAVTKRAQLLSSRRTLAFRHLFTDMPLGYANFIVPLFDLRQSKRLGLIRIGARITTS